MSTTTPNCSECMVQKLTGSLPAMSKVWMKAPLQLAASGARFRDEIMLTQPPPWVQRVVFAVLSPVARLLRYEAEKQ